MGAAPLAAVLVVGTMGVRAKVVAVVAMAAATAMAMAAAHVFVVLISLL